jgi:hypothetical protein
MERHDRAGLVFERFDVDPVFPSSYQLRVLGERIGGAPSVVGVGLAATWLLNMSSRMPAADGVPMLALFPYLGVDAAPYGAYRYSTWWASKWLRLAKSWPMRHVMASVAITPRPRGLEGVYAPRRLSWAHAAAALDRPDFAALVLAPVSPITVVLNRACPDLSPERAQAVLAVMNAHIDVAFAHPNVAELPEVVRQWAERCPSGMSSTMRVDDGRGDPDV